jgi:hypothetical protein
MSCKPAEAKPLRTVSIHRLADWNAMSIIYIGWVGIVVLTILGILGVAEDVAHEMRGRRNERLRR